MVPRNVAAMIHRHATFQIQPVRLNGTAHQRNRRGGNLPPATFRIQPVWLNGTTQCSGDDSSPCNVSNITRVVEWNRAKPSPSGKGDRHRRWMRCGTAFRIVGTMGAEVEHIEKATLALPLGELSPKVTERALRRFLNENVHLNPQRWPSQSRLCRASSPKGRAKGAFLRIRLLFLQHFTLPRGPHQARPGDPASPEGSSCTVLLGGTIHPHGLYSKGCMAMNHRRYIA